MFDPDPQLYAFIIFIIIAALSGILFLVQILYIQHLNILPAYILPFISFCFCFVNTLLARGSNVNSDSLLAGFGYVFHSFRIPLLIIALYESAYRLHETRAVHFFCFPFDQGTDAPKALALTYLWFVRLIAIGLFVMNILVDFDLVDSCESASLGGYIFLSKHSSCLPLWLSLIPSMVLSAVGLFVSDIVHKYGKSVAFGLNYRNRWTFLFPCSLAQIVGEIFYPSVYPVSSNAGEFVLLAGATLLLYLVQEDLGNASIFADFLHRSNVVFQTAKLQMEHDRLSMHMASTTGDVEHRGGGDGVELTELLHTTVVEDERRGPTTVIPLTSSHMNSSNTAPVDAKSKTVTTTTSDSGSAETTMHHHRPQQRQQPVVRDDDDNNTASVEHVVLDYASIYD
jgi:hypothetical protein